MESKPHSRHCVTAVTSMYKGSSYRCAVLQHKCTANWSGQTAFPTAHCCSAKQAHNRHYVTAVTPMEKGSSHRCAVLQLQCTAALMRAKCISHCSVLPCKTGSQQALFHCSYTYGERLFIQVCSAATPMHCSTNFGKMQSTLCNAALQNRLTACLCHCDYIYGDFCLCRWAVTHHQCTAAPV